MPDKKVNVLSQFLWFRTKKGPSCDIVEMADKIIEEYIYTKNRLIRQKHKKDNLGFKIFGSVILSSFLLAFLLYISL